MSITGSDARALELLTKPKVASENNLDDDLALAQAVDIFDRLYRRKGGGDLPPAADVKEYLAAAGWSAEGAEQIVLVWRAVNCLRDFHEEERQRPFHHMNLSPR